MIEKRLERIAMEKKGDKIEVDFDGVHATRKTVMVDDYKLRDGLRVSKEDGYIFIHPNNGSLDAEVVEKEGKELVVITRNNKRAID